MPSLYCCKLRLRYNLRLKFLSSGSSDEWDEAQAERWTVGQLQNEMVELLGQPEARFIHMAVRV